MASFLNFYRSSSQGAGLNLWSKWRIKTLYTIGLLLSWVERLMSRRHWLLILHCCVINLIAHIMSLTVEITPCGHFISFFVGPLIDELPVLRIRRGPISPLEPWHDWKANEESNTGNPPSMLPGVTRKSQFSPHCHLPDAHPQYQLWSSISALSQKASGYYTSFQTPGVWRVVLPFMRPPLPDMQLAFLPLQK